MPQTEKQREYQRRYYERNREKVIAQAKAYREANREQRLVYEAEYRAKNRALLNEKQKAYNKAHPEREKNRARDPERMRGYQRAYVERHRERVYQASASYRQTPQGKLAHRTAQARRRALKTAAPGTASLAQVQARIDYYGGRCYICGEPGDTLDHVIPLSRGGSNWPANLRPACRSCNSRKHNKELEVVLAISL